MRSSFYLIVFITLIGSAQAAQNFSLPALNSSSSVELQDYRSRTILLDFWASWCAPCLKSLPLYQTWHEQGNITVVSVNVDDLSDDATAMIQRLNLTFPVAYDRDKSVAKAFDVFALPVTFIIDQYGEVVLRHEGFSTGDVEKMSKVIKQVNDSTL